MKNVINSRYAQKLFAKEAEARKAYDDALRAWADAARAWHDLRTAKTTKALARAAELSATTHARWRELHELAETLRDEAAEG